MIATRKQLYPHLDPEELFFLGHPQDPSFLARGTHTPFWGPY